MVINKNLTTIKPLNGKQLSLKISHHHTGEDRIISRRRESRQTRRLGERTKAKAETAELRSEEQTYREVSFLVRKVFGEDQLEALAKQTGVIERKRELTAVAFVGVLMMGCVCDTSNEGINTLRRMCLLLRKYNPGIEVQPQALQKKINRKETAMFIKEIMSKIMAYKVDKSLKKNFRKGRSRVVAFYRILLQDSTVISLPDSLKRIFKGCGGAASEAAKEYCRMKYWGKCMLRINWKEKFLKLMRMPRQGVHEI